MSYLACTIVGDGSSDRALVPIVDWILREKTEAKFTLNFVCSSDVRATDLSVKIRRALALFPCDILFVHRDAEHPNSVNSRVREIAESIPAGEFKLVPVIPLRMTEAWLLFDVGAIRRAANNPNGQQLLEIPALRRTESIQDPKEVLFSLLRQASGLGARRIRAFNEGQARLRISELIRDYSPLRELTSFKNFESKVDEALSG